MRVWETEENEKMRELILDLLSCLSSWFLPRCSFQPLGTSILISKTFTFFSRLIEWVMISDGRNGRIRRKSRLHYYVKRIMLRWLWIKVKTREAWLCRHQELSPQYTVAHCILSRWSMNRDGRKNSTTKFFMFPCLPRFPSFPLIFPVWTLSCPVIVILELFSFYDYKSLSFIFISSNHYFLHWLCCFLSLFLLL